MVALLLLIKVGVIFNTGEAKEKNDPPPNVTFEYRFKSPSPIKFTDPVDPVVLIFIRDPRKYKEGLVVRLGELIEGEENTLIDPYELIVKEESDLKIRLLEDPGDPQ